MASVVLNALEIGAVQLSEKDHRIRIGIDSCAAGIVFQECYGRQSDVRHARPSQILVREKSKPSSETGLRVGRLDESDGHVCPLRLEQSLDDQFEDWQETFEFCKENIS